MSTLTSKELVNEIYLSSLRYCICGSQVQEEKKHHSCIVSGVARKIFTDIEGWKSYCIENGKRVASYYREQRIFPEHGNNVKNS